MELCNVCFCFEREWFLVTSLIVSFQNRSMNAWSMCMDSTTCVHQFTYISDSGEPGGRGGGGEGILTPFKKKKILNFYQNCSLLLLLCQWWGDPSHLAHLKLMILISIPVMVYLSGTVYPISGQSR